MRFLLLLAIPLLIQSVYSSRLLTHYRSKRQLPSYVKPDGANRYPGRVSSNLAPVFPFVHSFGTEILVEPGDDNQVDGFLNIPIPSWGLFDIGGQIETGLTPLQYKWGHLVAPVNPLGIEPDTLAQLSNDPSFLEARAAAPSIPAIQLPGGFSPLNCQPPICNPFTGSLGFGSEFDGGLNSEVSGALDFPIPVGANGLGVRFPLSGALNVGNSNLLVQYGQNMSPIDALGAAEAESRNRQQIEREAAARNFIADSQRMRELVNAANLGRPAVPLGLGFGGFPPIPSGN